MFHANSLALSIVRLDKYDLSKSSITENDLSLTKSHCLCVSAQLQNTTHIAAYKQLYRFYKERLFVSVHIAPAALEYIVTSTSYNEDKPQEKFLFTYAIFNLIYVDIKSLEHFTFIDESYHPAGRFS